jgi:hypothetical protein
MEQKQERRTRISVVLQIGSNPSATTPVIIANSLPFLSVFLLSVWQKYFSNSVFIGETVYF